MEAFSAGFCTFIRERMGGLIGGGKSSPCSPLFIFILRTATRLVTLFKGFESNVNKRPLCFRSVVGHARNVDRSGEKHRILFLGKFTKVV